MEPEPVLITFSGFEDIEQQQAVFTIDPRSTEWKILVQGHAPLQTPLCPASLYVELALRAARELACAKNIPSMPYARLERLEIKASLGISRDKILKMLFTQSDRDGYHWDAAFRAQERDAPDQSEATLYASGKVSIISPEDRIASADFARAGVFLHYGRFEGIASRLGVAAVSGPLIYQMLSRVVQYHDFYKGILKLSTDGGIVLAQVSLPEAQPIAAQRLFCNPVGIETFLQVPGLYLNCLSPCALDVAFICTHIDRVQLSPDFGNKLNGPWNVIAITITADDKRHSSDVLVVEPTTSKLVMVAYGVGFTRVPIASLRKSLSQVNTAYMNRDGIYTTTLEPSDEDETDDLGNELRQVLSKLTLTPGEKFEEDVPLHELGIDSLLSTEIASEMEKIFRISIPQADIQKLQTFASIRDYIRARKGPVTLRSQLGILSPSPPSSMRTTTRIDGNPKKVNTRIPQDMARNASVVSQLAHIISNHVQLPASGIDRSTKFTDIGLDSLLCIELISDIRETFDVTVDLAQLMTSNFGELTDIIVNEITPTSSSFRETESLLSSEPGAPDLSPDSGSSVHRSWPTFTSQMARKLMFPHAIKSFEIIKPHFEKLAAEYSFNGFFDNVYEKNCRLVLAYVVEAFADLGVYLDSLNPGEEVPQLNVLPQHRHLRHVLYEILREGRLIDHNGRGYIRGERRTGTTHSSALFQDITKEFPQHAKEHELLNLCGSNLADLISGAKNPLTVLFGSKANRTILEDVYSTSPVYVIMSQLLTLFMETTLSVTALGPRQYFRIIEIGAGTGSTTKWVVNRLVQLGIPIEYTFTDISSSFVSAGKRKFSRYDCMKYATLNIEKEPPAEYLGQYDIVLAANCLHATSNLSSSLKNVYKLLQPYGFVALVEFTRRMPWFDIVFGLLEGWWLFQDGRSYVLAGPESWEGCMKRAGFSHVAWTGGSTRESEVARVIAGFKRSAEEVGQHLSEQ
ncbi:hypothetical protein DL768_004175 [Monosporascus sp. mg162]|nr:hypothetical protein DL768_004175 [Monosporascus sp. mg162]